MKDEPMSDERKSQLYESGRRAKRDGCYRALANATSEERREWLAGYDDEAAEMREEQSK